MRDVCEMTDSVMNSRSLSLSMNENLRMNHCNDFTEALTAVCLADINIFSKMRRGRRPSFVALSLPDPGRLYAH